VGGRDDQVWHLLFEREDFAGQVADQKQRRPGAAPDQQRERTWRAAEASLREGRNA
jgi:chorismate mutase